jgi:UDPglucose--hexose-1-phosphate uridylyltransferase
LPELRRDPVTGRWVIFATDRARRPADFASGEEEPPVTNCPFCAGRESQTPPEIHAAREWGSAPNGPGWRVRVVPNKFPALRIEGELDKHGEGLYDRMNGVGAHEVIIEGAEHASTMTAIPADVFRDAARAYRERLLDLKKDRRLAYGLIFKNVGRRAGASIAHNHSQLIATPVVPIRVKQEMGGAKQFFDYRGRCIYCDILRQERSAKSRVVLDAGSFVAIVPYAARFAFETWVVPARHSSHFEDTTDAELDAFSDTILTVLGRLERLLGTPPYNFVIHTSPLHDGPLEHYHWHLEIMPRVAQTAGFEWGSGFYINPVLPEEAAKYLANGSR